MKIDKLLFLGAMFATCTFAVAAPTPEEKAAKKAEMAEKKKALLEKYDENKNGKLDPEEVEKAKAAGEKIPGKGGKKGGKKKDAGAE